MYKERVDNDDVNDNGNIENLSTCWRCGNSDVFDHKDDNDSNSKKYVKVIILVMIQTRKTIIVSIPGE